ncbi:Methyltransferase type 12 [Catenulispora acidiphila DSM 44928]|uniref:Small RNA 2'-O-methyltransferase n=1 Tax=Catenulispora acidiphila (strain DSM 44928 / JCM 14897 / NBRC 102108 / NRRL B-24433 / ID139908) TaxID=479433 RepID=C7QAQ1_CATAD|nr:3' terminal RNA ribose 2'-O-methyltransferase Hen1 [Catenulispora acidiphila]ACU74374.1 Methyltransferase type 12 [Catenulispora acidiphila DSM 44928]
MLLTITATPPPGAEWPATDLGFLLHKNPDRVQAFDVTYGKAHVFYPAAGPQECTAALLLEVDPIALVRGRGRNAPDFALSQYVNDRPYAASSLLASALGNVFRTALRGRCDQRPDLAATALPLRVEVPALICREPQLAVELFEPLGWTVAAEPVALDPAFPEWGASRYTSLTLTGTLRLSEALSHLFVLLAALDGAKHYWVASDEVDKLVRAGEGWLGAHPLRGMIARRYLARRQPLVREALARLAEVDDVEPEVLDNAVGFDGEPVQESAPDAVPAKERKLSLATARREAVVETLHEAEASRVLDLGCGEGALLRDLLKDKAFTEVVGIDVSARALQIAARKLHVDRLPDRVKARLTLRQGALTYTDARLAGYDAAVLMEVIEHVDAHRLPALEHAVFRAAHPRAVVVTTPNVEYNARYETLEAGRFRHSDHRFEWTRAEFRAWAERVAAAHGYDVRFKPVGEVDPELGPSTQLALFTLAKSPTNENLTNENLTNENLTNDNPKEASADV